MQHRPFGAGEDRNLVGVLCMVQAWQAQHRPFGAGEDRNKVRPYSVTEDTGKQHRPFGAGEDRNLITAIQFIPGAASSTGPSGPVRIATSDAPPGWSPSTGSTGPEGPVLIATFSRTA